MGKIKESAVSGMFYSSDKNELTNQIKSFEQNNKNYYKNSTRAVIVPHAGLVYSGRIAYEGINQLDKNLKTIFIIAPAHRVAFEGFALLNCTEWQTPLGLIKIDEDINNELAKNYGFNDEAYIEEHAIEVEIPLIQSVFEEVSIVPILVGRTTPDTVQNIIQKYYADENIGFVISSDLSHYLSDERAKQIDIKTAKMIETGDISGFMYEQACNAVGIAGLVQFANKNRFSLIRIDMENSGKTSGDFSRVVGYGSWFLYEGTKYEFIEKYYSKYILDLARTLLNMHFEKKNITINYPQVFDELGACFVTLEKHSQLRGCIGSIVAHRPLINDIVEHTKNAAFNDPRFNPVLKDELNDLKISVSILTSPEPINFVSEADLLSKIVENKDGIIIKDGNYQAVYLPSVWEQIPNKSEFLNSLKMKAGLPPNHFSQTFEAYRFHTLYIKE